MKTDRRHELQTNELADWMGKLIEGAKPYVRLIVGGVGLVLILSGMYLYSSQQKNTQQIEGWNEYYVEREAALAMRDNGIVPGGWDRTNLEKLEDLATRYKDTKVGRWAKLTVAEIEQDNGNREIWDDRSESRKLLDEADDRYNEVLNTAEHPFLKQRAILGLAQAFEARNDLLEAKKQYQAVENLVESGGDATIGELASSAIERLNGQDEFYAWFFDQQPKPVVLQESGVSNEFGNFSESSGDSDLFDSFGDSTSERSDLDADLETDAGSLSNSNELEIQDEPTGPEPGDVELENDSPEE